MDNKSRKLLRTIQPSAASPNSVGHSRKILESKITESLKAILTPGKENTVTLRRSKRRNVLAGDLTNTIVKKETSCLPMAKNQKQTSKSIQKPKKGRSAAVKKTDLDSNQSKLSFISVPSKSSCTEDLNSETKSKGTLDLPPKWKGSTIGNNITVFSDSGESNMLTAVEPPLQYWKMLAEERLIALEKVQRENEMIRDEIAVLEAENCQLKDLIKDSEQIVKALKAAIE